MRELEKFNEVYDKYHKTKLESLRINEYPRHNLELVNEKITTILTPELITDNKITEPIGISFNEVKMYQVGKIIEVSDGIYFNTLKSTDTHIQFLTYLMEGAGYYFHYHKDCFELTKVIKGNLIERTKNTDAVILEGESVMYAEGRVHSPLASKESIWEVNLYKLEILEQDKQAN